MAWSFEKKKNFCLEHAGKMARVNSNGIIGRLTSFSQNYIFLSPDDGEVYFDRSNSQIELPYLFNDDWFVVNKANYGRGCLPESVVILESEIETLIKALEL